MRCGPGPWPQLEHDSHRRSCGLPPAQPAWHRAVGEYRLLCREMAAQVEVPEPQEREHVVEVQDEQISVRRFNFEPWIEALASSIDDTVYEDGQGPLVYEDPFDTEDPTDFRV